MTNKLPTLGVVAALSMACGQANAADCVSGSIASITAAGFSCTLGELIFSNFTSNLDNTQAMDNQVKFTVSGADETIAFSRVGNSTFGNSSRNFNFTVMVNPADSGTTISSDSVTVLGQSPQGSSQFNTTATTIGNNSGKQTEGPTLNPFLHAFTLTGDTSTQVELVAGAGTANRLGSATNDFTLAEAAVPEPASLALFGLGLVGLGLARRRKRD